MSKRPNILMIMTDQHRADWLGCYGHPIVRTPHIDSIAATGTRFNNFNVATPVCMPNRASVFTGRFPSVHGARHNGLPLPATATTFVDVLRDGGYKTALIGKSHLQPMTGGPPNMGQPKPDTNETYPEAVIDDSDYTLEEPATYETDEMFDFPTPYYGFDHVDMVTGHGDRCGGHYLQWLRQQRSDWKDLLDRNNQLPHNYTCPQAHRTAIPEELYPTSFIRDRATDYLEAQADSDAPFFAFVSFPDPHHPFTPPGHYWDMYSPDQFSVDLPYEAHRNPPPHLKACHEELLDGSRQTQSQKLFMAHEQELKEAMALTAGMTTMIDDAVGAILEALKKTGKFDDTIIIFNADHGDYLGDFQMLLKGPIPLRSVNRVPFIWSDPETRAGKVSEALASTIDIAPTLIERAGLKPYYGIQGKSLLESVNHAADPMREALLIEHEDSQPKPGFAVRANIRTLLTRTHRMSIYRGEDWGELYDLTQDPNETNNLWDDPSVADVKSNLLATMADELIKAVDPSPWPNRLA